MRKLLFIGFMIGLLAAPLNGLAGSLMKSGAISASSGVPDRDLKYEDFQITDDGFITGYIVNDSNRTRPGVRIDMWTTNKQETRIFWRKSLDIGDLAPHAKYLVKVPYDYDNEEPERTEIKFRIPSSANFRNK